MILAELIQTFFCLPANALALLPVVDRSGIQRPPTVGDLVRFNLTVINSGGSWLFNVRVRDQALGLAPTLAEPSTLNPNDSAFLEYVYSLTQQDIDLNSIRIKPILSAESQDGGFVKMTGANLTIEIT